MEDTVIICLFLQISQLFLTSKKWESFFCIETTNENNQKHANLIGIKNETKLLRVLLKSDIAIFAWRVAKNYNYSPFKGTVKENEKGYRMKPENLMRSMIHIRLLSDGTDGNHVTSILHCHWLKCW